MRGLLRIARWRGVPVYVHWTAVFIVPYLAMFGGGLGGAVFAFPGYVLLILVHEAGHAWVARRVGATVHRIELHCIHGLCWCDTPYYEYEDYLIAWGGVAAQVLLLAAALIVWWLLEFAPPGPAALGRSFLVMPIWGNIWSMIFNLLPVPPLDGAKAWRIVPYGLRWLFGHDWRLPKLGTAKKTKLRVMPNAQPDMEQQMRELPEEPASAEAAAAASELIDRLKTH